LSGAARGEFCPGSRLSQIRSCSTTNNHLTFRYLGQIERLREAEHRLFSIRSASWVGDRRIRVLFAPKASRHELLCCRSAQWPPAQRMLQSTAERSAAMMVGPTVRCTFGPIYHRPEMAERSGRGPPPRVTLVGPGGPDVTARSRPAPIAALTRSIATTKICRSRQCRGMYLPNSSVDSAAIIFLTLARPA